MEANICSADLSRANLGYANVRAKLRGARLSRADLTHADFGGIAIHDADFTGANLTGTNLSEAVLSRANLSSAYLKETNFSGAELNHVNFSEAVLDHTLFARVDLRSAKGLTEVRHLGPSTIGIDTIELSRAEIPEVFLRGAGVPEPFITSTKFLIGAMSPIEFYSCFISYNHVDKPFARRLH